MRIIAGKYKGRRLKAPTWDGLRPTSDKLRETLFNILAPRIEGARLLDGYAGTGAVGIEALSRGAARVTFVEKDRRAIALIETNLAACGVSADYTIEARDLVAALRQGGGAYDVVWLDPPYDVADIGGVMFYFDTQEDLKKYETALIERENVIGPHVSTPNATDVKP